ncbi:MAG: helix-turn-helix transcriptional regulator [Lachnospiraceae bacterium]|nr:helix-turn-helix transcriptional regulator [Lachnospiraceae bacterium]
MQIGEVIRKYRKKKNMTQEEIAKRLGVTTPAVNKWEKGVTQPDIMLLAPIARLLDITLDTLLSFQYELTMEEISRTVKEIDQMFDHENYEEVFQYAQKMIQQYPNCEQLIWQLAVIMHARCMLDENANMEVYEKQILEWYERTLQSKDEKIRRNSAGSLFGYYRKKEMFKEAEEYLSFYPEDSMEKKRMQALLYSETNRKEEAYKAYEEILFSNYQMLNIVLTSLYKMSMQDDNIEQARKYIEKESGLAKLFEMGRYQEISCKLELAVVEKNVEETISIAKGMVSSLDQIFGFVHSSLYSHMKFKEVDENFIAKIREDLLKLFRDKETFEYMTGNEEWEAWLK